jgi:transposase
MADGSLRVPSIRFLCRPILTRFIDGDDLERIASGTSDDGFEQPLAALRGIAQISAVTIAAELGQVSRFDSARQLMGYCGAVPSENSSGQRTRRGSITKTGNAHLRRIVVEAAWSYQRPPAIWAGLRKRQQSASDEAKEIAWKAQHRLHKRYARLAAKRKDNRKIVTAVGRELLGFIWAIGTKAEATVSQRIEA